ncbi:hypothetical protein DKX38_020900 [Salix brachista]|uniref:Uncharacterized protein n=1 Tax=Salix brachista TaxID=2182728 RepID=A0A5N5KBR3_9ROSI|nr:hypothetical protein DKX38_020900 [Salix brachista]
MTCVNEMQTEMTAELCLEFRFVHEMPINGSEAFTAVFESNPFVKMLGKSMQSEGYDRHTLVEKDGRARKVDAELGLGI